MILPAFLIECREGGKHGKNNKWYVEEESECAPRAQEASEASLAYGAKLETVEIVEEDQKPLPTHLPTSLLANKVIRCKEMEGRKLIVPKTKAAPLTTSALPENESELRDQKPKPVHLPSPLANIAVGEGEGEEREGRDEEGKEELQSKQKTPEAPGRPELNKAELGGAEADEEEQSPWPTFGGGEEEECRESISGAPNRQAGPPVPSSPLAYEAELGDVKGEKEDRKPMPIHLPASLSKSTVEGGGEGEGKEAIPKKTANKEELERSEGVEDEQFPQAMENFPFIVKLMLGLISGSVMQIFDSGSDISIIRTYMEQQQYKFVAVLVLALLLYMVVSAFVGLWILWKQRQMYETLLNGHWTIQILTLLCHCLGLAHVPLSIDLAVDLWRERFGKKDKRDIKRRLLQKTKHIASLTLLQLFLGTFLECK